MSMSLRDAALLSELLDICKVYKDRRFRRGAEEYSDPLEARACFPEAMQEIDDAQTYMHVFRRRMHTWIDRLQSAIREENWNRVNEVKKQIMMEVALDPPGVVYDPDSRDLC